MSKAEFYRQCVLTRDLPDGGTSTLTTWLEEPKAIEGARVFIKDDPNFTEDQVYTISSVGTRKTAAWVTDRQKAHERWRAVTDV